MGPPPADTALAPPFGVALAGFMASGKSTVGKRVAEHLDLPFVDLDTRVCALASGRTVPQIFAEEGEAGFRRRELEALRQVCEEPPAVVALGGGTVLLPKAPAILARRMVVVVLEVPWTVVEARLVGDRERPLAGQAATRFRQRVGAYAEAGVGVDGVGTVDEVALRVIAAWRQACASR